MTDMTEKETVRIIAEAAVKLEEARDRIVELEELVEQQRKWIDQTKEMLRRDKYRRLSEHRRSM